MRGLQSPETQNQVGHGVQLELKNSVAALKVMRKQQVELSNLDAQRGGTAPIKLDRRIPNLTAAKPPTRPEYAAMNYKVVADTVFGNHVLSVLGSGQ